MPKLTETFVRRTLQAKSGTTKHWDSEIKGFGLFVGSRSKTWYYQRDVGGKTKRVLIGRHPTISAAAARETALRFAVEMGRGAGRVAQMGAPILEHAMEAYLARPKLRSEAHKASVRRQVTNHLGDWMRLPLTEITKSQVVARHQSLGSIPSAANHTLKVFRTIWNHARRTHDLPESPTMAIEWFEERPSGEIIKNASEWRKQVDELPNPIHRVFYELILFTGLRRSEALSLTWNDVHEDRIHLPMTKNGRSFDLPITQTHHEILAPNRALSRKWVFPSPKSKLGFVNQPQKIEWSPHAHRRTFATIAMEAGVMEEIVGRLLNHTPLSITGQRYVQPSLEALRPAMNQVCSALIKRNWL